MSGNVKARLLELVEAAPEWHPSETSPVETFPEATEAEKDARDARRRRSRDDDSSSSPDDTGGGRGLQRLWPLVEDLPLICDTTGKPYLVLDGRRLEALEPRNGNLVSSLLWLHFQTTGKGVAKEAVSQTIHLLSAKARAEAPRVPFWNRNAECEGYYFTDLKNGRSVRKTPGQWEIVTDAPVCWYDFNHQLPHPDPVPGGDPFRLLTFVNVTEEQRLLFVVAVISAFIPRISHPALNFTGAQGSGKSSASRIVKQTVDPSAASLLTMPAKPEDLDLLLFRHHVVPLDNLSGLPDAISDRLCNVISGAVLEKRSLFTDSDTTLLPCSPVVVFNGITQLVRRPDLADRTITITLERIDPANRREEREMWEEFEKELPGILGGIFDAISRAMAIFPTVKLRNLPRMADFCRHGFAIAEALGGRGEEFLRAYADNAAMQTADLHETDTLLAAIVQRMDTAGELEGNFREVLSILHEIAQPAKNDRSFPSSARSFRGHLERLRVPLLDMGITFTIRDGRTNRGRIVTFAKSHKGPESAAWGAVNQEPAPFAEVEDLEFSDDELSHEG